LVYIPVVPAEDRSIERVSSWRSPNYVETQVRLRKDWRSVLSRRFSSSIKTTNINTEEIFSVHSTFFFLVQKKILLVLVLGRHQRREEEEQFRSKKWPSEHCSLPFDRQETKHQLTFPDFTSTILEHPDYWRRRK
jgi:hypothetical protein